MLSEATPTILTATTGITTEATTIIPTKATLGTSETTPAGKSTGAAYSITTKTISGRIYKTTPSMLNEVASGISTLNSIN